MSGSNTQPAPDDEALVQSLLGRVLAEPQRPAQAPAAEPSFVSLLGSALGGGGGGLSGADREQAGNAALMNFGINMLANSGWTTNKKTFGQILGSGLAGAQESMGRSQEVAAARGAAQQQAEKDRQEMQLARIKEALPLLTTLGDYKRARELRRLLQGDSPSGGAAGSGAGTSVPRDPSIPTIGQQANNPGNLSHGVPGSTGYITAADGQKVGVFPDVATGVAAHADQLARYAEQGVRTPQDAVNLWVHGTLTPDKGQAARTAPYAAAVAAKLGVKPGDPINLADPAVQRAFILAQQPHESGKAWLSAGDVDKGIAVAAARRQAAAGGPSAKPGAPPPPSAPRPSPSAATEAPDVAQTGVQFAGPGVPAAPADAGTVAEQPGNQALLNRLSAIGGPPDPAPAPGATAAADAIQAGRTGGVAGPDPTQTAPTTDDSSLHPNIKAGDSVIRHPGTFQQYYDQNAQPVPKTEDFNPNLSPEQLKKFAIERAGLARDKKVAALMKPGPELEKATAAILQRGTALDAAEQEAIQAKRATADANITKHNNTQLERINPRYESEIKRYGDAAAAALTLQNTMASENNASANRIREEDAKQVGARVQAERGKFSTELDDARTSLDSLAMLRALSNVAATSTPLEDFQFGGKSGREWMIQLGLGSDAEKGRWQTQQAFQAASNMVLTELRKGVSMGALSDGDLRFLQDMMPKLPSTPETRGAVISYMEQMKNQKRLYIERIEEFYNNGKGGMTWDEAKSAARKSMPDILPRLPGADPNRQGWPTTPFGQWDRETRQSWREQNLTPYQMLRDHNGNLSIYFPPGSPEAEYMAEQARRAKAGKK